MTAVTFKNRREAGKLLAHILQDKKLEDPIVLALPQGGIPIAEEITNLLRVPYAVLVTKKIEAPADPDSTIAVVSTHDVVFVDPYAQKSYDITEQELATMVIDKKHEIEKNNTAVKQGIETYYTAIIVDDGSAPAITLRAAITSVKIRYNPKSILIATPICPRDTLVAIKPEVGDIIYLSAPDDLISIDLWYDEA